MGANPNIFINKENRRVVPPEEENFFVSAEEFKAIDTAFATKADQSSLDTLSGSVSGLSSLVSSIDGEVTTLQTDLTTLEGEVDDIPFVDTQYFELVEVEPDVFETKPLFAEPTDSEPLPSTGGQVFTFVNTEIDKIGSNREGSVIDFTIPLANYGTIDMPLDADFTISYTGAKPVSVFVLSKRGSVPTIITEAIAESNTARFQGDAYDTSDTAINILEIKYALGTSVNTLIKNTVWDISVPEFTLPGMILFLKMDDTWGSIPATITDSSPDPQTVSIVGTNISNQTGIIDGAQSIGLPTSAGSTYFAWASNLVTQSITTQFYFGFFYKLPSTRDNVQTRIGGFNIAFTSGEGLRCEVTDTGQIRLYIAPTADDASNRLLSLTGVVLADDQWHFMAFNYDNNNAEIIHDGLVIATTTDLSGRTITTLTDFRIGTTAGGSTKTTFFDDVIICNQALTALQWGSHYDRRLI